MYILQNSFKNLGRNKGRNLLIGFIILAIISATAVALVINTTTGGIIKDYKSRFGAKISIVPDMKKLSANNGMIKRISFEQYLEFSKSQYLKESFFQNELPAVGEGIKAVNETKGGQGSLTPVGGGDNRSSMIMPTMKVKGYSRADMLDEFSTGTRKIIEGKLYENKGECIVSQEFAKLNNINAGSKIKVKNAMENTLPAYTLTVSGIYQDATEEYGGAPFRDAFMNKRNEILTSFETASSMSSTGGMNVTAIYYLKSPDVLSSFENELRQKGLPDDYNVSADKSSYNKIVGPVESLSKISFIFMIVVFVLGSIILILLSTISIRERKYEIGVLRAMGMKKAKVALGIVFEILIITSISLCIGLFAGTAASQPIADSMLKSQIAANEQSNEDNNAFGNMIVDAGAQNEASPLSQMDVNMNLGTVLRISAIALLLAGIASATGISYITKYEPIKILSERN